MNWGGRRCYNISYNGLSLGTVADLKQLPLPLAQSFFEANNFGFLLHLQLPQTQFWQFVLFTFALCLGLFYQIITQ